MRLIRHPDSSCPSVHHIDVMAARTAGGRLNLTYCTYGVPWFRGENAASLSEIMRMDDLWRHTCFEAFVRPVQGSGYFEFNFSPALEWAAYRFDGYRQNRRNLTAIPAPMISAGTGGPGFQLTASLTLSGVSELDGDWQVGISAVIEEANGNISYWALKHPRGPADFHHADGFALELPATSVP